jgi:hypothetical protein
MTLEDTLERLGLDSIDTQLRAASDGEARQGATTWMLVEACRALLDAKQVLLVGHNMQFTKDHLVRTCLGYFSKLGGHVTRRNGRRIDVNTGGILLWESHRTQSGFWRLRRPDEFEVFVDGEWQIKAFQRAKGPFAMVRVIRCVDDKADKFQAFDEDDVFLFDLAGKSVDKIMDDDPYRVRYEGPTR